MSFKVHKTYPWQYLSVLARGSCSRRTGCQVRGLPVPRSPSSALHNPTGVRGSGNSPTTGGEASDHRGLSSQEEKKMKLEMSRDGAVTEIRTPAGRQGHTQVTWGRSGGPDMGLNGAQAGVGARGNEGPVLHSEPWHRGAFG